jgi:hypothetical protein
MSTPGYQVPGRTATEQFPDSGYWNQQYRSEPYYMEGDTYDDYAAAYETGYAFRQRDPAAEFAAAEEQLRREWETRKGKSRLDWTRARQACCVPGNAAPIRTACSLRGACPIPRPGTPRRPPAWRPRVSPAAAAVRTRQVRRPPPKARSRRRTSPARHPACRRRG